MDHDGTLSSAPRLLHTTDEQHTALGQVSRLDGHERLLYLRRFRGEASYQAQGKVKGNHIAASLDKKLLMTKSELLHSSLKYLMIHVGQGRGEDCKILS